MNLFYFGPQAVEHFLKVTPKTQRRILVKLKHLKEQKDIFSTLAPLKNMKPATHRLRVGSYRLILELKERGPKDRLPEGDGALFLIVDIGHRREIYR
jgi:mRNA-degrading endonuclease RelE of RelBE toxin-antitoxin system